MAKPEPSSQKVVATTENEAEPVEESTTDITDETKRKKSKFI